jgi:hypothetical protein
MRSTYSPLSIPRFILYYDDGRGSYEETIGKRVFHAAGLPGRSGWGDPQVPSRPVHCRVSASKSRRHS